MWHPYVVSCEKLMLFAGATVLTVIATDSDTGNNGTLTYRLTDVPQYNGLPMFAIDPHNGLITTVQSNVLDRELTSEYQLTVVATDRGRPRMSGALYSLSSRLVYLFAHTRAHAVSCLFSTKCILKR